MVHSQDHATRQPICGVLAGEITDYRGRSLGSRVMAIALLHLGLSVVLSGSGLAQSPPNAATGSQKAAGKPVGATAKEVSQVEPKEVTPDTKPGSPNPPPSAKSTNPSGTDPATASEGVPEKKALAPEKALEGNAKLVRLSPTDEIWIDPNKKRVVVGGTICLREGFLEMFACPKGTKEHESIVSVNAKAYQMHTALLAIGARVGNPVKYDPYRSASGSIIHVEVVWHDQNGKTTRRPAQSMIRDSKSKENMKADWVFAGSGFWVDAQSGEKYYQAEGGELICLSNFSTAMLDLPVESSRDNASLLFEADSEKIPPRGTHVLLVLTVAGFHQGGDSK